MRWGKILTLFKLCMKSWSTSAVQVQYKCSIIRFTRYKKENINWTKCLLNIVNLNIFFSNSRNNLDQRFSDFLLSIRQLACFFWPRGRPLVDLTRPRTFMINIRSKKLIIRMEWCDRFNSFHGASTTHIPHISKSTVSKGFRLNQLPEPHEIVTKLPMMLSKIPSPWSSANCSFK